jgi:hypothetical protein
VVGVVLGASLGLAACSSDRPLPEASGPVGEWTLGLDSQPTRAASAGDRAYVSTAGDFRFPPQLYLIDTTTGVEIEHRTATGQPYDLLVARDGRLWVAGDRHPDQPGGGGINVYDPDSLVVVDHVDLPAQTFSLAEVGDELWVGSEGGVFVLDPATLDVRRTLTTSGPAFQLVVLPDGSGILAVEGNQLELLGSDGTVIAGQPVDSDGNIVATATETEIFVRAPVGADSTVLAVDPLLATTAAPIGVDTDSTGGGILAGSAGDVVLVDDRRDEVLCLPDAETPPVSIAATDLVGVLAELPAGRYLFATSSGVAAREIDC